MSPESSSGNGNQWWVAIITTAITSIAVIVAAYISRPADVNPGNDNRAQQPPAVKIKNYEFTSVTDARRGTDGKAIFFDVDGVTTGRREPDWQVCLIAHRHQPERPGWFLQECQPARDIWRLEAYDGGTTTLPKIGDKVEIRAVLVRKSVVDSFRKVRKDNPLVTEDHDGLDVEIAAPETTPSNKVEFEIVSFKPGSAAK